MFTLADRVIPRSFLSFTRTSQLPYSTTEGELRFSIQHVNYKHVFQVKKDRFGVELQKFKSLYEAPMVNIFEDMQEHKNRQVKKRRNRDAHKAYQSRRRDKKVAHLEATRQADENELNIQDDISKILDQEEVNLSRFLTSSDPQVLGLLDKNPLDDINLSFDAFDDEAIQNDKLWSIGYLNAAFMPNKLKNSSQFWLWEKNLPLNEWLKVISSDLVASGLPVRDDMKVLEGSLEQELSNDFEEDGQTVLDNTISVAGIKNPLEIKYKPVEIESPAILKQSRFSKKAVGSKHRKIKFSQPNHPFILETIQTPLLDNIKKQSDRIPVDFLQRKAKLRTFVHQLGMPSCVLNRLIELAGNHYNPKSLIMTIVSSKKPTLHENIANIYKIMRALFNEAWKADLNYIPSSRDPLMPHQLIEKEIACDAQKKEEEIKMDPESFIKSREYVLFRLSHFPHPSSLTEKTKRIQEIADEIKSFV